MTRRAALALATAFTTLTVAGCGGGDDESNESAEEAVRQQVEQLQRQSVEQATVDALFGALCGIKMNCGGLDRELPADRERTVENARAVCSAMATKSEAEARAEARKRFSRGSFKVNDKIADDVVHILKIRICDIV